MVETTEGRPEACEHRAVQAYFSDPTTGGDGMSLGMWACAECRVRFYPACPVCVDVGHRNIEHLASLRSTSRDSEVREAIEGLRSLAADGAAMAHLNRWGVLDRHDDGSFRDCTADRCVRNRAILDRSSEAAPTLVAGVPQTTLDHGYSPRPTWGGTCPRCGAEAGSDCAVVSASEAAPTGWDAAMQDPTFRSSLDEGLADVAAGRVKPYPRIVAVDENGIPSLVTHYRSSEAAPTATEEA